MIKKLMVEKSDRLFYMPQPVEEFLPKKERAKLMGQNVFDLARFKWPATREGSITRDDLNAASETDTAELARRVAAWYKTRFGVKINPRREIFFGGSIRQILNLFGLSFLNPGDVVLVPDPGVWHYRAAAVLASAESIPYHLTQRNHYKPLLKSLADVQARLIKAMFMNSPQNPTGAKYDREDFQEILRLAGRENIMLVLDQAFEGLLEPDDTSSLYAIPGGRKFGLELYSFAYNFGRPLPSCGFAIGQPALISGLKHAARAFGITLTRYACRDGLEACEAGNKALQAIGKEYAQKRQLLDEICRKLRLEPAEFRYGPFYWAKLPGRKLSQRFCRVLYLKCGIQAMPGVAFGENGEGYIRFSLTAPLEHYKKAIDATGKLLQRIRERKKADGQDSA